MSVESSTTLESVQVGSLEKPLLSGEEALCAGAEDTLKNRNTKITYSHCCNITTKAFSLNTSASLRIYYDS